MKFRIVALLVVLSLTGTLHASLHRKSIRFAYDAELDEQQLAFKSQAQEELSEQRGREVKALIAQGIEYDSCALTHPLSGTHFYLGAANTGEKNFALTRAFVTCNSITGNSEIFTSGIAPIQATVSGNLIKNPIFDSRIAQMSLLGTRPVVLLDRGIADPLSFQIVAVVADVVNGVTLLSNVGTFINDANGNPTSKIVGIQAATGHVFAPVAPQGGTFGQAGSGVALLLVSNNDLQPVNAADGKDGNLAEQIKESHFQIAGASGDVVVNATPLAMHWDRNRARFYIALALQKDAGAQDAGSVAILVGRILPGNKVSLQPLVALDSTLFTLDSTEHIFGFFADNATELRVELSHLATLDTTTALTYLIVAGGVGQTPLTNTVFSLPLLRPSPIGDGSHDTNIGLLAQNDATNTLVTTNAQMPLSTAAAAMVGSGPLPIEDDQTINQLFVFGQAVFAAVSGDRSASNREAGLFTSTPLFADNGSIRAWTKWRRVIGSVDPVHCSAIDRNTGDYWYITEDEGGDRTVIKKTRWGLGESNPGLLNGQNGNQDVGLRLVLEQLFPHNKAGVAQLFDFDCETPGFDPGAFSMMVAVGLGQVALIETGRAVGGVFSPNKGDFASNLSQNIGNPGSAGLVQVYNDDVITDLGPLCASDVSRHPLVMTEQNSGWLFVGGHNGVAVLSDENGDGWSLTGGLGAGFSGITDSFTFKKIGSFTNVKKIVCDGTYLYVLTGKALFRVLMNAAKFSSTPVALAAEIIATPLGVIGEPLAGFADFCLVGKLGILATTHGLFYGLDAQTIIDTLQSSWIQVLSSAGRKLGSLVNLYVQRSADGLSGNLFVTAADFSFNISVIYMFNAMVTGVTPIADGSIVDYFIAPGELRTSFFTDGIFGFHLHSRHFGDANFLKRFQLFKDEARRKSDTQTITLSTPASAFNVGTMVYNSASGARLVPGDWGIRINE